MPIGAHAATAACFEVRGGRAAQVSTDADANEDLGLARANFVLGIFGSEARPLGFRVGQQGVKRLEGGELFGRTVHDPHRFPTPFHGFHGADGYIADIHFNGGPGRAGLFRGRKCAHKRHCRCDTCYATHSTGGGNPETSRRIRWQVGINRTVIIVHQRILTHLPILVDAPALRVASLLRHRVRGNL
ncbi:hypothetical protein D3C77_492380 [compost metagenome]